MSYHIEVIIKKVETKHEERAHWKQIRAIPPEVKSKQGYYNDDGDPKEYGYVTNVEPVIHETLLLKQTVDEIDLPLVIAVVNGLELK